MKVSRKRKKWAETRGATVEGKPLRPSKAAEVKYRVAMDRLVERMVSDYEKELLGVVGDKRYAMNATLGTGIGTAFNFLQKKWARVFGKVSRKLTDDMVKRVDLNSRTNLNESLKQLSGGITIKTPEMPKGMREVIAAATTANVSLIKTIPSQFHQQIESRVMASIQQGGGGSADIYRELSTDLKGELVELRGSTKRRAELIARDQTSKITAAVNKQRMESAGITHFKWRHSGGGVDKRELHVSYDGEMFSFDEPPVIEYRRGVAVRGLPGEAINCGCVAIPVIDFGGD